MPAMRARIADALWQRLRSFPAAVIAMDSYLQTVQERQSAWEADLVWSICEEYLERAIVLAKLCRRREAIAALAGFIRDTLAQRVGSEGTDISNDLLRFQLTQELGPPDQVQRNAVAIAQAFRGQEKYHEAGPYLTTAVQASGRIQAGMCLPTIRMAA
jgi:hypothetical protein